MLLLIMSYAVFKPRTLVKIDILINGDGVDALSFYLPQRSGIQAQQNDVQKLAERLS